ncbi:RhoGAP domain protein [Oesophagostomum dentatum]|uniref:RhoGAP domain protein n=1 Tax=Oesophagostomum dentatum TaxID=61180 RepID=A0A0B1SNJ4_OESDE|nr:RhoGAP domain protein [Oesophagostomum dentatum]
MKTIWQRPMGAEIDIIPLAKLQSLKENTESAEHARVRRTCETQTSPAIRRVGGGSRRVIAQNIGPETGIIMTRTASRSSNGTVNGMQQSFDWMSLDDQSDTLSIGERCDYRDYNSREYGRSPRQFPPFPTMGTTSTMSTAPSADSIPPRSSRVPADPDQLMTTKARLDMFVVPVVHDPHVPAGLLKLWLRQLPEPLIPHNFYQRALSASENPAEVTRLIQMLPSTNQLVLAKLISCLQDLSREEVVAHTKMDVSNLAMVMAPNVLR